MQAGARVFVSIGVGRKRGPAARRLFADANCPFTKSPIPDERVLPGPLISYEFRLIAGSEFDVQIG